MEKNIIVILFDSFGNIIDIFDNGHGGPVVITDSKAIFEKLVEGFSFVASLIGRR